MHIDRIVRRYVPSLARLFGDSFDFVPRRISA